MTDSPYWTSAQAAAYLNYRSLTAFNRAVHQFGIPHRYTGGRLAFQKDRLDGWVKTFRPGKRGPKPHTRHS